MCDLRMNPMNVPSVSTTGRIHAFVLSNVCRMTSMLSLIMSLAGGWFIRVFILNRWYSSCLNMMGRTVSR